MKYKHDKRTTNPDDIVRWWDDNEYPTWCYRFELWTMSSMSDDYSIIPFDSPEYKLFLERNL